MPTFLTAPARRLALVLAFNLVAMLLAILAALQMPWLGLRLAVDADGAVVVAGSEGPAAGIPVGARGLSLAGAPGGAGLVLTAEDLREEPDVVADYVAMDAFFARQGELAAVLREAQVQVGWQMPEEAGGAGERSYMTLTPDARPLSALPGFFWFQMAVAVTGCLIAGWVWALRPGDWGARMFAMTGLSFPVFALPAAVYSSRELALDGNVFAALSALNHWGAVLFGAALVGVFLCYPRQLVRPVHLLALFAFYNLWWLTETLRLAPDLDWGHRFIVMSEMLLALGLGVAQWFLNKGEPVNRAALRWFMLSMLLGSGLFILTSVTTLSLGWLPPLPQGYAFGFFLFIYLGIGLGLARYRLFELHAWAYRLLIWLGSALAVVALDVLLIMVLDWSAALALAVSLWIVGLVYFPARQWLWRRLSGRPRRTLQELLVEVVQIAMQAGQSERDGLWQDLLQRLYNPLERRPFAPEAGQQALAEEAEQAISIAEQGLALRIPPRAGLSGQCLRYPERGVRLFRSTDADFVAALLQLIEQAETSRAAQERGASEERRRIARDVHDDVGARLLMLMHHAPTPAMAELARAAMQDLRTALAALDGQPMTIGEAVADWRAEADSRCEAANVELHWQARLDQAERPVSARWKSILERALRECLTNALKHARTPRIAVAIVEQGGEVQVEVRDQGAASDPASWREGHGLRGMRQRLGEYQGRLEIEADAAGGTRVSIRLPFAG